MGRHPFGQRIVRLLDEFKLVGVNGVRILFGDGISWAHIPESFELFLYIIETINVKVLKCEHVVVDVVFAAKWFGKLTLMYGG